MYNSQYYTCEQIDERLLQGYLDDYNVQHNTNLTKAQYLTLLGNLINNFSNIGIDNKPTRGSVNVVNSDGVSNYLYPNNPVGLKGFTFCELGGYGLDGILNNMANRARIISKNISKISLKSQTNLKFCIFGNNEGIGHTVTQVVGWQTEDFINNTEYEYLFVMVSHTSESLEFEESPILYLEFSDYHGLNIVSDSELLALNNFKPVSSDTVFRALLRNKDDVNELMYPNNPIGLKGFIFCELGGYDANGGLNDWKARARIISKNISKISTKGQIPTLKFCIFGNNEGIGHTVTQVIGWQTTDFINNTEYEYLFVMVARNANDSLEFEESPMLYLEFSDYHGLNMVSNSIVENNFKPVASDTVFKALANKFDKSKVIQQLGHSSDEVPSAEAVHEALYPNNHVGLKGYLFCEPGNFGLDGKLHPDNLTRAQIISKNISKISLKGQPGLKFAVFGNNDGINHNVTAVTTNPQWVTEDFINDTEYEYLFVVVGRTPNDSLEFEEMPLIYMEFTELHPITDIQDSVEKNNLKPVTSDAIFNALKNEDRKIDKLSTRLSEAISLENELHPNFDGNNGFYTSSGTIQASENLRYSDMFGVREGQTIVADVGANELVSVISYFDEHSNYLADISVIGEGTAGSVVRKKYVSVVPEGAVACAISGTIINDNYIKVYRLKDLSMKTLLVERNVDITDMLTYTNGFYYDTRVWQDADNWRTCQKIDCSNIKSISANIATNNRMYAILFFDKDGNAMYGDSILGDNIDGATVNANVPEFAKYFVISSYIGRGYIIGLKVNLLTEYSYLEKEVRETNKGVHNWFDVKAHEDYTIALQHYYINNTGAAVSIEGAFVVSAYIDASNINAVRFMGRQGPGICNCAWYAEQNEASVVESRVATQDTGGLTVMTYEKPLGANYFRLSFKHDTPYKYEFSAEKSIKDSLNQRLIKNPIEKVKRMSLIIIYGQSLSVGADSTIVLSTSPYQYNNAALMFKQGVKARTAASNLTTLVPLVEASTETPARGLAESFVESIMQENLFDKNSEFWNERQMILSCPGVGGATIDELVADNYYQYVENIITAAYNYCNNKGYELEIPVWCWLQGEQDLKASMSTATYKSKLLALHDKVCTSIQTITGITKRPKCIIYQPSAQSLFKTGDTGVDDQFDYDYDHMGVPTAFMELARDNDEFIASAPTYILDPCPETAGYWIHCSAQSYKLLGAMLGYNLKKYMIDGISNKGVVPTDVSVSGTMIKIKYNVPCPPLSFDTDYVRKVSNMGFSVVKSDNSDIISNVSLFNDTVTIECTESPSGCKLRYGMNGDFTIIPNPQYPYRGVAGREHGARGNLRDNQGNYIFKEVQNIKHPLHNWAYTFEMLLN